MKLEFSDRSIHSCSQSNCTLHTHVAPSLFVCILFAVSMHTNKSRSFDCVNERDEARNRERNENTATYGRKQKESIDFQWSGRCSLNDWPNVRNCNIKQKAHETNRFDHISSKNALIIIRCTRLAFQAWTLGGRVTDEWLILFSIRRFCTENYHYGFTNIHLKIGGVICRVWEILAFWHNFWCFGRLLLLLMLHNRHCAQKCCIRLWALNVCRSVACLCRLVL